MIYKFKDYYPSIHKDAFVAESADVIGNVKIEEDSSIWFGTVVRGDTNSIFIDKKVNVQDNCTLHIDKGEFPVILSEGVTVGHGAIVHGCKIGKYSLIGMGSIILNGAEIGEFTIIGAGSLITSNKKIPSGVLCMGSPAKVIRELTKEEKMELIVSADHYVELSKEYKLK